MSSNSPISQNELKVSEGSATADQNSAESETRSPGPSEEAAGPAQPHAETAGQQCGQSQTVPQPVASSETATDAGKTDQMTSAPVPAEPDQAQASSASAPPEQDAAESGEAESGEREGRVRLNPEVDVESARPVPSLAAAQESQSPPAAAETPADASTDQADGESTHTGAVAASPVEVPPKDEALDAELEAEIDAALAAEDKPAAEQQATQEGGDAAADQLTEEALERGTRLKGKVQSVHGENVFLEIGTRSPAIVSRRQFPADKTPEIGREFELVVDRLDEAEGVVVANLRRGKGRIAGNWNAVSEGQVVDCMVTKTNKGGLEVTVSNLRGFMPASQVDTRYVSDLQQYVGQKLRAVITEANPKKRNLIVSRRRFLDIEREAAAEELWKTIQPGHTFTGTVKTIKEYGAFVDIGGVDGFLHVGEISWSRIDHPSDVLSEGQPVEVRVLKLDPEKKRISLGMKQLTQNPWETVAERYAPGSVVNGTVTRTMNFGAFVELEPGVEGLVHISELDYQRVNQVTDVLDAGQQVELKVLDVDSNRRRIGLSLKQLKEKPPEFRRPPKQAESQPEEAPGEADGRKRRSPLKGGTSLESDEGGRAGLFGDPKDFQ